MSKILLFFLFVSTLVFIAVGTDAADGSEGGKREVDFYSVFPFVRPSVRKRLTNYGGGGSGGGDGALWGVLVVARRVPLPR